MMQHYRKLYNKGELEKKNMFESRVLAEEPKFVQKRRKQCISDDVSTFLDWYKKQGTALFIHDYFVK